MVKINEKIVDTWTIPHAAMGFIYGRFTGLTLAQFTLFNALFEIAEACIKRVYDPFNLPFGRETVLESPANTVADFLIAEAAFGAGRHLLQIDINRPMIDYMAENYHHALTGVEIGVDDGRNAERILTRLPIAHLYCIDPYVPYAEYSEMRDYDKSYAEVSNRLAPFNNQTLIIKRSEDAINDIPNNVDFVYIDGNHAYEYVLNDIILYYSKVRPGGIIGGHDIYLGGVKDAVIEFATTNGLVWYRKPPDWWIIKPTSQSQYQYAESYQPVKLHADPHYQTCSLTLRQ